MSESEKTGLVLSELPMELVESLRAQWSQYEGMTEEAYAGRLLSAAIQAAGQEVNAEEPEPEPEPTQEEGWQESDADRMYQLGAALNQCWQLENTLLTEFTTFGFDVSLDNRDNFSRFVARLCEEGPGLAERALAALSQSTATTSTTGKEGTMCGRVLELLRSHHPTGLRLPEILEATGFTRHQACWCLSILKRNEGAVKEGNFWIWTGAEDVKFYLERHRFEDSGVLESLAKCLAQNGETFRAHELSTILGRPSTSMALLLRSLTREGIISSEGKSNGSILWRIHPQELEACLAKWRTENGAKALPEPEPLSPKLSSTPTVISEKSVLPEALVERTVTLSLTHDHGIHTECTATLGPDGKPQYVTQIRKGSTIRTNRPGLRTQGGSFCAELLLRGVLTHKNDTLLEFVENYPLTSSLSYAAHLVTGTPDGTWRMSRE